MMKNKKITTVADLQNEKAKLREAYLYRESALNEKLNYLQNNFGAILLQTISFRKQNRDGQNETDQSNGFISSLIKGFTGVDISGEKGEMLMAIAKTALPAIVLSLLKGYLKKKFSK